MKRTLGCGMNQEGRDLESLDGSGMLTCLIKNTRHQNSSFKRCTLVISSLQENSHKGNAHKRTPASWLYVQKWQQRWKQTGWNEAIRNGRHKT